MFMGSAESEDRRLISREFSKYSNLCDHDTSTSQKDGRTDRQADGQTTCMAIARSA